MRNNTLANALKMLKGELGITLTSGVGTAQDQELYTLLDLKQQWLAGEFDWPFLQVDKDVTVAAQARYATLPTSSQLDFSRQFATNVMFSTKWKEVVYGIGIEQYNTFSSGDGGVAAVYLDPIERWRYDNDGTEFEVWPRPVAAQTFRFSGMRPLTSLKSANAYLDTLTLDLDDIMVVMFCAAEKLSRLKPEQAKLKLDIANQRIKTIKCIFICTRSRCRHNDSGNSILERFKRAFQNQQNISSKRKQHFIYISKQCNKYI
jgi:hypothetical protein